MSYKLKILNGVLKLKTFSDVVLNILGIKDLGTQTGEVTDGYIDWSMQQITKTTAEWNGSTYILLKGQVGVEDTGTTTFKLKVGDGVSTWQQLGYISGGGANDYPENLFLTVVNKTGDNLLASGYKVLKVQDAQGQRLAVDYALADSNGNSTDTIGVVYENIDNNQSGRIVVIGEITGIDTTGDLQGETWNDGDVLYLSSSTPGNLTKVQPIAPNHLVVVGYVVYAHANQGKIYCKVQNGWEIGELHDCYLPSPSNNDGIFWNSTTTRYENKSITTVLGYTPYYTLDKNNVNVSLTGTTTETILDSSLITAGTIEANDRIIINVRALPTGISGSKTLKVYANDSLTLTGATLIATYTFTTTSTLFVRNIVFKNSVSSQNVITTSSIASDVQSSFTSGNFSTLSINFATNKYIILSGQLTVGTDTITINDSYLTLVR